MNVKDSYLQGVLDGKNTLLFDGAMGTMLQAAGLAAPGQLADLLCISHKDAIEDIHRAYVDAGAQVATTNTFSSNRAALEATGAKVTVMEVFAAACACARAAGPAYVAGDIGSTGQMFEPYGDLEPEQAHELFAEQAHAAAVAGADFVLIETIPDVAEAEIAIRAAKEATDLPVFASMTFEENGFTLMGDGIADACMRMEAAGADVVGINCSHGPDTLKPQIAEMAKVATRPVLVQPNAGMPEFDDGQVVYPMNPEAFAASVREMLASGATVIGSCCGSTPEFTAALAKLL